MAEWDDSEYEDPTALTDEEHKVVAESFRQFDAMKARVEKALADRNTISCSICPMIGSFTSLKEAEAAGWMLIQEGPICPVCLEARCKRNGH